MGEACIHRVHNGDLLIHNDIGIIRHAVGHYILTLEQVHLMVIDAYIFDIVGNEHSNILLLMFLPGNPGA
jgi:hypothetical protein